MKKYIKQTTAYVLTFLLLLFSVSLNAQKRGVNLEKKHPEKGQQTHHQGKFGKIHTVNESMVHARKVMKRTQFVIVKAKQAVSKNKNYTGDLARAVAHQKQAKKMFAMKNHHKSVLHSRQARMYAFYALQANKSEKK